MFTRRKPAAKIFINYRRDDARWVAGRLADSLGAYFGDDRVFRDIEGIAGGAEFGDVIQKTMHYSDAIIVLIGPDWLGAANNAGERRLDDPNDWVSREIAAALQRDIPVYPVLIDSTPMPRKEELPESLKPLVDRNAMSISDHRWNSDVTRMAKTIAIDIPGSRAERKLDWACLFVSLTLFLAVFITTAIVMLNAPEAQGLSFSDWFSDWFGEPRQDVPRKDVPRELVEAWQAGISYLFIMPSAILLLVMAPRVDRGRRSYMYAGGLVGVLGAGFFFVLRAPLDPSVEDLVTFCGSTVIITGMFVLMNLSGFKPK